MGGRGGTEKTLPETIRMMNWRAVGRFGVFALLGILFGVVCGKRRRARRVERTSMRTEAGHAAAAGTHEAAAPEQRFEDRDRAHGGAAKYD